MFLGLTLVEGLIVLIGVLVVILVWPKTPEEPDFAKPPLSMDEGETISFPGMMD